MSLPNDLRIVVLNCPYKTWDQEITQRLFSKMVGLKIKAYQEAYGNNTLPIDSSDFVATHLLLCSKSEGNLTPLMGFRSIELSRCKDFRLLFSPLSLLKSAQETEPHLQFLEGLIQECINTQTPLHYLSSWAISPQIRTHHKELVHQLTPFFGSMIYFHHYQQKAVRLVAGGAVRFRVPNLLKLLGFEPIQGQVGELPQFGAPFANNTPIQFMRLERFSAYARHQAMKYRLHWENRLIVEDSGLEQEEARKVA